MRIKKEINTMTTTNIKMTLSTLINIIINLNMKRHFIKIATCKLNKVLYLKYRHNDPARLGEHHQKSRKYENEFIYNENEIGIFDER